MVRHGLLLQALGRRREARERFQNVLDGARGVAPRLLERHREWLDAARRELDDSAA